MSKAINSTYYDIIRRPLITEKATMAAESNKYFFEVSSCADKLLIKKAVEAVFGVKVKQVNVSNSQGKRKLFKGREGFRSGFKRAIVTLEQGQTIDLTSGV
ncbi:MAG: 50S ribosomal protein L23 [Pseudomonadota bacterium]